MNRLLFILSTTVFASVANAQDVSVTLSEWKLRVSRDTVRAGIVNFEVTNSGTINHALRVAGPEVDKKTRDIAKGEIATLTLTLKAGTYELYCPLSEGSHKMAGMSHTLVVTPAPATPPRKKPGA